MEEEKAEKAEPEEPREKIVVVRSGMGCLAQMLSLIFVLFFPEVVGYFIYNHQLNKAIQSRLEMNEWVVKDLRHVSDGIYDLTNLEITGSQPAKAFFIFYRKDQHGATTQTTYEVQAQRLSGGVFKVYNPPTEIAFGLSTAMWFHERIIKPQLPEYNFLLATPYSLEFCTSLGDCKMLKKTAGFSDENGKFSYFF